MRMTAFQLVLQAGLGAGPFTRAVVTGFVLHPFPCLLTSCPGKIRAEILHRFACVQVRIHSLHGSQMKIRIERCPKEG